jgi:hypothetical protein
MANHPRVESRVNASFVTTRCRNSELWFANNRPVEKAALGYAAKFKERYGVKLYALALEGSHIQAPAHFPNANRKDFMRDFNSCVADSVKRLTPNYPGGSLFGRRYSGELLPDHPEDIEKMFFYTVLQPVHDGLVERISDYPFYNCFSDAVKGIERQCEVMNWTAYNAKRRYNPDVRKIDFIEIVTLKYDRLPGYESLSQKDYSKLMHDKLEVERVKAIQKRIEAGKLGVVGREALLKVIPGTPAKNPKKSTRESNRPRVLSACLDRWQEMMDWYFSMYNAYKYASKLFREGNLTVRFPDGMYPPYLPCSPPA